MPTASTAAAAKVTPDEGQASIEALFTFTDTEIEEAQPLKVPRRLCHLLEVM
jgi:Mor family transcriptional regulator